MDTSDNSIFLLILLKQDVKSLVQILVQIYCTILCKKYKSSHGLIPVPNTYNVADLMMLQKKTIKNNMQILTRRMLYWKTANLIWPYKHRYYRYSIKKIRNISTRDVLWHLNMRIIFLLFSGSFSRPFHYPLRLPVRPHSIRSARKSPKVF